MSVGIMQYQKGVKHLYENGIQNVPGKYVLPESERPKITSPDGCSNLLKLPAIDCAQLQGSTRSEAIKSLAHACQNYGFFQLTNHGIPDEIVGNMSGASKEFFAMPFVEREKYMSTDMSSRVRYGTSLNQNKDRVFCWRDFLKLVCDPQPDVLAYWPSSPFNFKDMVVPYAKEAKLLFMLLVEAILESLGLSDDDSILRELENGSQIMVLNCYPPCPNPDLTMGLHPHSDYGFLTLLHQDEVSGLQINHKDDWFAVQPMPGSFVVNVGDTLEIFSNGRYKSVLHRVTVNSTKYRISVASLHSVSFATKVEPSSKLIDESNPRRYKDMDFLSYLEYVKSRDCIKKSFVESRKI